MGGVRNEKVNVYGAAYDEDLNVVHSCFSDLKECEKLRGSKYVVSSMRNCFTEIAKQLQAGESVLFSGTPCQVSAIKHYLNLKKIRTEHFCSVDIICHGTPDRFLWDDYREWLEAKNGSELVAFSFRYKGARWRLYPCMAEFANGKIKINTQDTRLYTTLFFSGLAYRECCYGCKFANLDRQGDITLGDFWGFENVMPSTAAKWNIKAQDGVSLVVVNSEKGRVLWEELLQNSEQCSYELCSSNAFIHYQHNLNAPTERLSHVDEFREDYKKYGFEYVAKKYANYDMRGKIRFILSRFYHEWIKR